MKHIKLLGALGLCCGLYGNCFAYAASAASPVAVDPTLLFFTSLSSCIPGNYTEQNDMFDQVGQPYLNQRIIDLTDNICNVILTTPDHRNMTCTFPMEQLAGLTDQHFLQGIVQDIGNADQSGISADTLWSQLKTKYCTFSTAESGLER